LFITTSRKYVGDGQSKAIFIGGSLTQKWPKNGSDQDNNEYELPILKYDANQDKLVERKGKTPEEEEEGTLVEEEKEPKRPMQSASKEGEDSKISDKECCGSNNGVSVKLRHQKECGSPSYVYHCMHTYK
jgi:hypothetical protein